MSGPHSGRSPGQAAVGLAVVIGLIIAIAATFQFTTTEPGQTAVVRNGGPLDSKSIRQIVPPAAGLTWTGWFSSVREYPVTERYTNVIAGTPGDQNLGDTVDVDAYRANTKDGIDVGLVGQWKFILNTADDPTAPDDPNRSPLRAFDTAYGQRTYAKPGDPATRLSPGDGDDGFAVWLGTQVRPVQQETMRAIIGDRTCTSLIPQCALVNAGTGGDAAKAQAALASAPSNAATFQKVADDMSADLLKRINGSLGGPYISEVRFNLTQVTLPPGVQAQIDRTQQQFAAVAEANGRAQQAAADATANEAKQRGYNACTTCADLDRIRAQADVERAKGEALAKIPPGVQVYAPGSNTQVPVR